MRIGTRVLSVLASFVLALPTAAASDTSFTYQGVLNDAGAPASGSYTVAISAWTALAGGSQVGFTQTYNNVQVVDGRFTLEVDFGGNVMQGDRWLQLAVNGTTLSPRQPVTGTPYAQRMRGMFTNANGSFVGVGRNAAISNAEAFGVHAPAGTGTDYGGMYVSTPSANAKPFFGYAAGGTSSTWTYLDGASDKWHLNHNGTRLTVDSDGDFGVGTVSPNGKMAIVSDGSKTGLRISNGGGSQTNTGLIIGDVTGAGRAASFYGITSANLVTFQNDGSGDAARFLGDVAFTNGNVGIGTISPIYDLQISGGSGTSLFSLATDTGIVGATTGTSASDYGVFGQHPSGSSWGIYASGRLGASGTKSFRIDHPMDPGYKYLLHYCSESPEPLNVYSGVAALDDNGEAWVDLPEYFGMINRDPRYQLTCIGGHADVYIADEIEDNRFRIAGGRAGIKVSWEVKGTRHDAWVREYGAPTEMDKPEEMRGKYQHPELYGLPNEFAEHPMPEPEPEGTVASVATE